jgi:MFS family permease
MGGVVVELWRMIRSRSGVLCGVLCILPIGTGAATNVLSQAEVAAKWGVAEGTVSLVNGVMNGLVSAVGCLIGGELCARYSSRRVYAAVGLLMAGVAAAMAAAPFIPSMYVTFILAYALTTGLAYAAFTGFVLDAIGRGAAATKYNGFASISNLPITYMGIVLAEAFTRRGAKGMLLTEAAAGVLGILVLGVVASVLRTPLSRRSSSGPSAPPPPLPIVR